MERLDFARKEALDPRMVRIAPGCRNEYHKHAHESLFVVLSGQGRVLVDGRAHVVAMGDVLFVPRWVFHQTINTSPDAELVLLAVTDFGLTSSVLGDYDQKTRLRAGGGDVRGAAVDEASGAIGPADAGRGQP